MEKLLIPRIELENTRIEKLTVFLDDDGNLIVLPFLWALHLSVSGSVYKWTKSIKFSNQNKFGINRYTQTEAKLEVDPITQNTIKNYLGHIFKLLNYLNTFKLNSKSQSQSVHYTELLTSNFLNRYLNEVLPLSLKSSSSLNAHQSAITAYLTFLFDLGVKELTPTTIFRKTNQLIAELDDRPKKINYISKEERSLLLKSCSNARDKLVIRLGYEVGLRTSENQGLLLRKKNEKDTPSKKGLLNLFFELDHNQSKMSFGYLLDGKYTKGGKSRNIYFSRELLQAMKDYYENERLIIQKKSKITSDSLLLRADHQGFGETIGEKQGTITFSKLRNLFPNMNETLSYHDLRHTFATELYYGQLLDSDGQETRSESAALLTTSQRLGHQDSNTSKIYIRLKQQMLIIESEDYER